MIENFIYKDVNDFIELEICYNLDSYFNVKDLYFAFKHVPEEYEGKDFATNVNDAVLIWNQLSDKYGGDYISPRELQLFIDRDVNKVIAQIEFEENEDSFERRAEKFKQEFDKLCKEYSVKFETRANEDLYIVDEHDQDLFCSF